MKFSAQSLHWNFFQHINNNNQPLLPIQILTCLQKQLPLCKALSVTNGMTFLPYTDQGDEKHYSRNNKDGTSLQQSHVKQYPHYLYIIQSTDLTRNKGIYCLLMKTKGIMFFQEKPNNLSLYMTVTKYFIIQNSGKCITKNICNHTSRNFE
jgi:hypothetical protein